MTNHPEIRDSCPISEAARKAAKDIAHRIGFRGYPERRVGRHRWADNAALIIQQAIDTETAERLAEIERLKRELVEATTKSE